MNKTDNITKGPIIKTIFSLSIPVVLNMFMEFALITTDYFWVGKMGPTAQDAVMTSMVVIWTVFGFISIITVGVTALVSRHIGAEDPGKAAHYIKQGLSLSAVIGITFSICGYIMTPTMLEFMGTSQKTMLHAIPYLRVYFSISTLFFVIDTIYAAFRASGDTKTPTIIGVTTIIINMGLDPILMFGWGPIPAFGVPGAAAATGISVLIGVVWVWIKMQKGKLGYKVDKILKTPPVIRDIIKIMRIGLPISSQQLVFVIVYWFLIRIVHEFGEEAAAAMGIGNRLESFSYMTCFGFSIAASTMVGQNLGAKKPDRAAKCAWGATGLAIGLTFLMSICFIVFPKYIATIFTDDPNVLNMAIDYLIILGLSQITMATEIVLEGAFSGAGDTMPPMIVSIPGALARIPLAYYLCFTLGMGINGVWWTLTITTIVRSIILALWFKKGNWKLKEV